MVGTLVLQLGGEAVREERYHIADVPQLVGSASCAISAKTLADANDIGGYYVVGGEEYVIIGQENPAARLFRVSGRESTLSVEWRCHRQHYLVMSRGLGREGPSVRIPGFPLRAGAKRVPYALFCLAIGAAAAVAPAWAAALPPEERGLAQAAAVRRLAMHYYDLPDGSEAERIQKTTEILRDDILFGITGVVATFCYFSRLLLHASTPEDPYIAAHAHVLWDGPLIWQLISRMMLDFNSALSHDLPSLLQTYCRSNVWPNNVPLRAWFRGCCITEKLLRSFRGGDWTRYLRGKLAPRPGITTSRSSDGSLNRARMLALCTRYRIANTNEHTTLPRRQRHPSRALTTDPVRRRLRAPALSPLTPPRRRVSRPTARTAASCCTPPCIPTPVPKAS